MVDGGGLENHCTGNRAGGSNPSPSANPFSPQSLRDFDSFLKRTSLSASSIANCAFALLLPGAAGLGVRLNDFVSLTVAYRATLEGALTCVCRGVAALARRQRKVQKLSWSYLGSRFSIAHCSTRFMPALNAMRRPSG